MAEWENAELLRKEGNLDEALAAYRQCCASGKSSGALAGVVHCLRRLERYDEAEEFVAENYDDGNATPWMKDEHAWVLYGKYIKPAKVEDTSVFMDKATVISDMATDLLVRKLTAFKVTDILGKELDPDWEGVRQWLDSVRDVLDENEEVEPEKKKADKWKWLLKYTKALEKLGRYRECREICLNARKRFRNNYFFRHRAVKCLMQQPAPNEKRIMDEYRALQRIRNEWFLSLDLAEYFIGLRKYEQAEHHLVLAIRACDDVRAKIRTYFLWAQILAAVDPAMAWIPLWFYVMFRKAQEWPVSDETMELAARHPIPETVAKLDLATIRSKVESLVITRFRDLRHMLPSPKRDGMHSRGGRSRGPGSQGDSDGEVLKGKFSGSIKNLREKFGFIKGDDGNDYFFSNSSFDGRPRLAVPVEFRVKKAFDRRKRRMSFEAFEVRPLR